MTMAIHLVTNQNKHNHDKSALFTNMSEIYKLNKTNKYPSLTTACMGVYQQN